MLKFWIFITILALVIDVLTSNFFFAGFAIGGIGAMGVYSLGYTPMAQGIVFCLVSILSMLVIIPYGRRARQSEAGSDISLESRFIGRSFILDKDIEDEGLVEFDGIYWTMKNVSDHLYEGDRAVIVGIEGNKLLIEKTNEGE